MATHSSILAWEVPQTEKPGRLQSMRSQRVRHDLAKKQQQQQTRLMSTPGKIPLLGKLTSLSIYTQHSQLSPQYGLKTLPYYDIHCAHLTIVLFLFFSSISCVLILSPSQQMISSNLPNYPKKRSHQMKFVSTSSLEIYKYSSIPQSFLFNHINDLLRNLACFVISIICQIYALVLYMYVCMYACMQYVCIPPSRLTTLLVTVLILFLSTTKFQSCLYSFSLVSLFITHLIFFYHFTKIVLTWSLII